MMLSRPFLAPGEWMDVMRGIARPAAHSAHRTYACVLRRASGIGESADEGVPCPRRDGMLSISPHAMTRAMAVRQSFCLENHLRQRLMIIIKQLACEVIRE